jgi:hypothetical protein
MVSIDQSSLNGSSESGSVCLNIKFAAQQSLNPKGAPFTQSMRNLSLCGDVAQL